MHYETNNIENGGDSNGIYKNKIPALYNHEHKNNYILRKWVIWGTAQYAKCIKRLPHSHEVKSFDSQHTCKSRIVEIHA